MDSKSTTEPTKEKLENLPAYVDWAGLDQDQMMVLGNNTQLVHLKMYLAQEIVQNAIKMVVLIILFQNVNHVLTAQSFWF
jgi:hypothetical protein